MTGSLRDATRNKYESTPIGMRAIDATALSKWPILDAKSALDQASRGLDASGLLPQFGTPVTGHTVLTLYSRDGSGNWASKSQELDTQVSYTFSEPGGHPLVGPGARVQVTYDGTGHVSQLHYAARQLTPGASVQILSEDDARARIARLMPANSQVTSRLVYWSPPLQSWLGRPGDWNPTTIIPWYAFYGTTRLTNPATGQVSVVRTKVRMIPATDDARFVPAVQLTASAQGSQVSARVSVSGGTPPYTYVWAGSDPAASLNTGDSITYTPQFRVAEALARDDRFRLDRNERVTVTVIDANGVVVNASNLIPVHATPVYPRDHGITGPSYGCESPADPGEWTICRVGWQTGMGTSGAGGGVQSYCWMGDDAWPGGWGFRR